MPVKLNRQSFMPVLMIFAGGVLILGAIGWFVYTPQTAAPDTAAIASPVSDDEIPYPQIKRVGLADAKAAYDLDTAVFLDVRGEPYYSQRHISGAISIAEDELAERLGELDRSTWIITYCT